MGIRTATTDTDIAACYPVMRELRPQVPESEFVSRVRSQEQRGYRLAVVDDGDGIVGVAGFRIAENLAWGRFLYVDDLVVLDTQRSRGCGARLLAWLRDRAVAEGCQQLHLDSGLQREAAHRFYEREGMAKAGFHFAEALTPNNPVPSASRGEEVR
ncbi:MAG: GNAT family N-acetyltransferase [Deferrisomatales bacterium]|nr:GNAT family N-acetyltransferase [Deferrisomatales bacterium]